MSKFKLFYVSKTRAESLLGFITRSFGRLRLTAMLLFCSALLACASGPKEYLHSFEFNAAKDSPDLEVLDYRYGSGQVNRLEADRYEVARSKVTQKTSVGGYQPRGENLYVKWRIKKSGEILDRTINLALLLPENIENHTIYFVVQTTDLLVYLITPVLRPLEAPSIGPYFVNYYKTHIIYPDKHSTIKY